MKINKKLLFFFCACVFCFIFVSSCSADLLTIPAPPEDTSTELPDYLIWVYKFLTAIGFWSIVFSLVVSGVLYILSSGIPSMLTKAKEWLTGAVTGFLIFMLIYLILITIYPPLVQFTFKNKPLEVPDLCPEHIHNPDGTVTCPPGKLHGVYFYEKAGCGGTSFSSATSLPDLSGFTKNAINSVKIVQDPDNDIYHIAIIYGIQGYFDQCQYINPNDNSCDEIELKRTMPDGKTASVTPKSASIYTYNWSPEGTVTFYRNGVFDKKSGYLTLNASQISSGENLFEVELNKLKFNGESDPGSENIDDCTVPKEERDCKMWNKKGECPPENKTCPTLANENIGSISIDGDYLVVLEYLPNGLNTMVGEFCEAYPRPEDVNKFGPKQVKWDGINNTAGVFANYVFIIPIDKYR